MEQKLKAGIYRIYDEKNKRSFLGYTYNLKGILKRFRFELNLNMCTHKPLQAMYNESGKNAQAEVLEEIAIDPNEPRAEEMMNEAMLKWQQKLEADGETVNIILL